MEQNHIPLVPTVKDELLFQTGAPELVVKKGELKALDGRYCTINRTQSHKTEVKDEVAEQIRRKNPRN